MKISVIFALAALAATLAFPALALADDTYVAPLDEDGSDEQLREEGGSGFDNPGPVYIDEEDYAAGDQGDGTWTPDVPEASDPDAAE